MKTCLTIAGSDSSGGAGIQADLKTFAAHGVYGMSAITALTAQNTMGVHAIENIDVDFVRAQIKAVFDDIQPDAIKIGMLANTDIIQSVAQSLSEYRASNVVLDPVMIATSGDPLLNENAIRHLIDDLVPLVDIITPNTAELIALCNAQKISINTDADLNTQTLKSLTRALFNYLPTKRDGSKVSVLSKGGHLNSNNASDYLVTQETDYWFSINRVDTNNTHGTGCTLSASICAHLALGESQRDACNNAKNYLTACLNKGLNLGSGNGPLRHN